MISYELALKLKDTGFQQDGGSSYQWTDQEPNLGKLVRTPTLEELIEACGNVFQSITKVGERWFATAQLGMKVAERGDNNYPSVSGDTPEEAVANLYLALNKK